MLGRGGTITLRDDLRALPFLLPFLGIFVLFIGYPVLYSLWISLHRVTIYSDFYDLFGSMEYVGFGNYTRILADPVFWWSIALTCIYAVLTIFPGIALSLALALALNRKLRGFGLMRSGFYLPNVFDVYVVGVIWLLIYNPQGGPFAALLQLAGADFLAGKGLLNTPATTLPAIALTMVLKNAGFGMILFLISLNNINPSLFEAAEVDGTTKWQKLTLVTIPLLRGPILFLVITGMMATLNAFGEIYAMTDDTGGSSVEIGGVTLQSARTSGYHLYKVFAESLYGEAAAISFLLLLLALGISYASYRIVMPRETKT